MASRNSFKSGSCELLVLHILKNYGDCYAYQISQFIQKISNKELFFPEGSLYPCFYKMMDNKYITDYKRLEGRKRVRIYYHLEAAGEKRLEELRSDYFKTAANIEKILDFDYSQLKADDEKNK